MTDVYGPGQEPPTNKPTVLPPEPPPPEEERRAAEPTPQPTAERKGPSHDEKNWAMACHLSALAGYLTFFGFFVGPLIVWLVKKDEYPLVDDQGKEALNFNITVGIIFLALLLLSIVTLGIGLIVAIPLWIIIGIAWLVLTIIAAIKANQGIAYRYPLTLRLIK